MPGKLFEYLDTHHMTNLAVTENEVIINGVAIPISAITEVVFYPIVQNERGLGGWIKFMTEDRPELPEKNYEKGWRIRYDGNEFFGSGTILTDINCFGFGCGWGADDWKKVNQEMEKAVMLVNGMIGKK
ncbi:MAG: hypothetical protein IJI33_06400 [Solobacterium sp.]|nr:hypothetical protein [Solobacterium sp.]